MGGDGATPGAKLNAELLGLLCCPETRQQLRLASDELVRQLESLRVTGRLCDRAGKLYDIPITAGLVREDGGLFFPIRDGIPVLVSDAAIALPVPES